MGAFEWRLFFACIWFKGIATEASSWTSQVPSSVKGLPGSCVVIPCSFNYPDSKNTLSEYTGIWKDQSESFIFHPTKSLMLQSYQSRVALVGDVRHKNCSLKIDPLRESDTGPFSFRIEIKDYDNFSFKEKVSISMIREPNPIIFSVKEELKVGQSVSASCSVFHSCPASPPLFNWSHTGELYFQSQHVGDGQWNTTSILTFRLTHTDHNKPLQCNVTYKGGHKQYVSKTLKVKYAPVNVKVEYKSDVKEGETVKLTCTGDAHPPVSSYEWHNENVGKHCQGNLCILPNVSRHLGPMYCIAINEEGKAPSNPVQLNVLYAPEIKTESSCSSEDNFIKCECIVDSKPSSEVRFVLANNVLLSPKEERNGSYTISVLLAEFQSSKFVQCMANNTQGRANLTLSLPTDGTMQIIYIASGAGVFVMILLIAVGVVIKCRRRSGDTQVPNSTKMNSRALELPRYDTTNRKEMSDYDPCTETYANNNIYGNVGGDWDDAIYGNV